MRHEVEGRLGRPVSEDPEFWRAAPAGCAALEGRGVRFSGQEGMSHAPEASQTYQLYPMAQLYPEYLIYYTYQTGHDLNV